MGRLKKVIMAQLVKGLKRGKTNPYVWVFSSTDNSHYNYNSRYLFEYVKENVPEVTPYFVINDRELRKKLADEYGEQYFIETESVQGIRKVLSAGVWFTSAGLPVYGTGLKKDRIIVNLWHGVPLKKIALLDPNLKPSSRMYFQKIFTENYSYILTTSSKLVPLMAKSFNVSEEIVKVWGQPRNDGIFQKIDRKAWLESVLGPLPEYNKIVLYAPTFRDYGKVQLFPFEDFNAEELNAFLEKEKMILFLRTHIKEKGSANLFLSDRIRYLGDHEVEDVTGVLGIFDCLITDYSSIYVDYLLTDGQLIFLPYDKELYLDERGMNFEYDEVTPGPKPNTQRDFLRCLKACVDGKDSWKKERDRVNVLLNEVKEPCAARICDEILREIKH